MRFGVIQATVFAVLGAAACGQRGSVTFTIHAPGQQLLDPITDRVSEYTIKKLDGTLVGVASVTPSSPGTLQLGPLMQEQQPIDLVLSALSGTDLLGMARLKDVSIQNGVQKSYTAEVRKTLLTVGSALPDEKDPGNKLGAPQVQDPTTGIDLVAQSPPVVSMPQGVSASGASWDGRFVFVGSSAGLGVIDTSTGQMVGVANLGFQPTRIAVGARDSAVIAVEPGGTAAMFGDVSALETNPGGTQPVMMKIAGQPRMAVFTAEGQRALVLTGGALTDPCNGGTAPAANAILAIGLDGQMQGTWNMPGFVSDVVVDPTTLKVVITESVANRVSSFDPATPYGPVQPTKLEDATCPTAVRAANGVAFVVTAERPTSDSFNYTLLRKSLVDNTSSRLPFVGPLYNEVVSGTGTDQNEAVTFRIRPRGLYAYDMAVTPDGARALFAVRARYAERSTDTFTFLMDTCRPNIDIVEYGLYILDTRSGSTTYQSRSQLVLTPANYMTDACATCKDPLGDLLIPCIANPGDRPAGLAAVFGGP